MTNAATADEAIAQLSARFPCHSGDLLLSLIAEYWQL